MICRRAHAVCLVREYGPLGGVGKASGAWVGVVLTRCWVLRDRARPLLVGVVGTEASGFRGPGFFQTRAGASWCAWWKELPGVGLVVC